MNIFSVFKSFTYILHEYSISKNIQVSLGKRAYRVRSPCNNVIYTFKAIYIIYCCLCIHRGPKKIINIIGKTILSIYNINNKRGNGNGLTFDRGEGMDDGDC